MANRLGRLTAHPGTSSVESHPTLRRMARSALAIPFAKTVTRKMVRFAIQRAPFSNRNKQRLYNLFAPLATSVRPVTCRVAMPAGGHFLLKLNLTDDLSRNWYYWGYSGYERSTVLLWERLIGNARTVFDIGANIGLYTLLAAARLQGRGMVHSFEPNPEVFFWLSQNMHLNKFAHANISQKALSDSDGEASFFIPRDGAWTNGSLIEGFTEAGSRIPVDTTRFDSYCSELGISRVDLIKIDVEGAELNVLKGMGPLLREWWPDIILEVLAEYASALNEFFRDMPYRKFLITSDGLQEASSLRAHPQFRDYYLSCVPNSGRGMV